MAQWLWASTKCLWWFASDRHCPLPLALSLALVGYDVPVRWEVTLSKRRSRGDGSVYFDVTNRLWIGAIDLPADAGGRRRRAKVSGRTKTQALIKLRELRRRADAGDALGHERITVAQAVEDFLDRGLPAGLASNTRYVLGLYAGRFAASCGGRRLLALTTRDVEDFLRTLADEGKARRTLVTARAAAARVLDHAIRQGWLPPGRNQARVAVLPAGRAGAVRPALTQADIAALLEAAGTDRWTPLLATVAVTGCRIGEAIAQAWADIDTDGNIIAITGAARHEAGGGLSRQAPKRDSVRRVGVPAALSARLAVHRRQVAAEAHAAGRPVSDLAFPTAAGTMANRRTLDRWLDQVAARTGVQVKGWHDLRHALATDLGDDGTPLTRTAAVLGHRSVDTTSRVYTHPTSAADAAIARGQRLLAPQR